MNFSGIKSKTLATAMAALVAGSAFGYWGYAEYKQREFRTEVIELVGNTSHQLRDALGSTGHIPSGNSSGYLSKLYDDALAVDANFRKLHSMDVSPAEKLGDAAEDYVLTSREILLRWASSHRYRQRLTASIQALQKHMHSDDRTGAWVSAAVRAKERVEEDYRDYRFTTDALAFLLESFPASRAKISSYVDSPLLSNNALIAETRKQVIDASKHTAEEVHRARQLVSYR